MEEGESSQGPKKMAQYLVSVDAEDDIARVLSELMLERGARAICPGEWILETASNEAMTIYEGIAAVVGIRSVFVKEFREEPSWDHAVINQKLFFEMLASGTQTSSQ